MTRLKDILFTLTRSALGSRNEAIPEDFADWRALVNMFYAQEVSALMVDGYNNIARREHLAIESAQMEALKYEWFGTVLLEENEVRKQKKVLLSLAEFYRKEGIRMMLLKGYGLALNYPVPDHRRVGDIDVYLFGKWREADAAIQKIGVKVDNSHHHHSVFNYRGQTVENHYDFVNIYSHRSSRMVERRLKELAREPGIEVMPNIFLPSANLSALFVARHAAIHFAAGEMVFKQMLDWILLVRRNEKEIDWPMFWNDVGMMGMIPFVLVMVHTATVHLCMDEGCFHLPQGLVPDAALAEKVLDDTLGRALPVSSPKGLPAHLQWMLKRWWANRWKHRLVYTDSLFSTFFSQIYSHLLKPATMKGE